MQVALSGPNINTILQRALPLLFIAVFALTCYGALQLHLARNPWVMGDWLINYRDGFVQRGLIGQMFSSAASITQINPGIFFIALVSAAYGVYFYFSWRLPAFVSLWYILHSIAPNRYRWLG